MNVVHFDKLSVNLPLKINRSTKARHLIFLLFFGVDQ